MNKQILIINERKKLFKWLKIFHQQMMKLWNNLISIKSSVKRYFYSCKEQITF